jgi:hypothetical protein
MLHLFASRIYPGRCILPAPPGGPNKFGVLKLAPFVNVHRPAEEYEKYGRIRFPEEGNFIIDFSQYQRLSSLGI